MEIKIHKVDGSIATFTQSEATLLNGILDELHPVRIFNQERIRIACNHYVAGFIPSSVTRVDLITDQLSVWDFPFVIGALRELTEAEFHEFLQERQRQVQIRPSDDYPIFLDIEMVNSQHSYLWMDVIAGFLPDQFSRACSLLKERNLIFGLAAGGIGVLNPANLLRFRIHPNHQNEASVRRPTHEAYGLNSGHLVSRSCGPLDDVQSSCHLPREHWRNFNSSGTESK